MQQFSTKWLCSSHEFLLVIKRGARINFLYTNTGQYYDGSGQESIDPVVFFKFCLGGYAENLTSDRQRIDHSSMRLDSPHFFLKYFIICLATLKVLT